jgi:hypothetical protein
VRQYQRHKGGKSLDDRRRTCAVCGAEFNAWRANARFCSVPCRMKDYNTRKAEAEPAPRGRKKK